MQLTIPVEHIRPSHMSHVVAGIHPVSYMLYRRNGAVGFVFTIGSADCYVPAKTKHGIVFYRGIVIGESGYLQYIRSMIENDKTAM